MSTGHFVWQNACSLKASTRFGGGFATGTDVARRFELRIRVDNSFEHTPDPPCAGVSKNDVVFSNKHAFRVFGTSNVHYR